MSSKERFLQPFEDFIVHHTGASRDWARCNALFTLSAGVGNKVKVYTMVGAPIQLNLYVLGVGPSGVGIKTVPMMNYSRSVLKSLEGLTRTKFILPSSFTPEGLHEYFLSNEVPEKDGAYAVTGSGGIIKDEFSRLVIDVRAKLYLSGMMEFLNELDDGFIKSRYTKEGKYQREVEVFVSLITASTPYLFTVLRRDFFTLGTGNRFLYVYCLPEEIKRSDPSLYFTPDFDYEQNVTKFAKVLQAYNENCENRTLIFSREASDLLTSYEYSKKKEALTSYKEDILNIIYPYKDRLPIKTFKIASLEAIDRQGHIPWKNDKDSVIDVEMEDAKYSIDFVERCFGHFQTLIDVVWKEVSSRKLIDYRRHEPNELLEIIDKNYDERTRKFGIINSTKLRRMAYSRGFSPQRFNQCISILRGSDEVKEFTRKTRTKPSTFYKLVKEKAGKDFQTTFK